jgi:hypothetical protein
MKKQKLEDTTIYTTDDLYSPRKHDLDKQVINLLWLLAMIMIVVSILN